jgi:hypothetical protein
MIFLVECDKSAQFTVFVNGVPDLTTTSGLNKGANQLYLRQTLTLHQGDLVSVQNYISSAGTVNLIGDAGGALGAALAAYYIYFGQERKVDKEKLDAMKGSYLGPEYSDLEVEQMSRKYNASFERFEDFDALAAKTASLLADGNVIGWFQGRMEFGPRALGGRSILGDARNAEMQKKLNLKIKYREGFRPFAPSVLAAAINFCMSNLATPLLR